MEAEGRFGTQILKGYLGKEESRGWKRGGNQWDFISNNLRITEVWFSLSLKLGISYDRQRDAIGKLFYLVCFVSGSLISLIAGLNHGLRLAHLYKGDILTMAPRFGGDRWTSELWFQHSLRTKVQFCSWLVSLVGLNGSEPAYW